MTRAAIFSMAVPVLRKAALMLTLTMGVSCTGLPTALPFGGGDAGSDQQFSRGSMDRLWVTSPGALVMVQRAAPKGGEQIIGLVNDTSMSGDNFLWLGASSGRALSLDNLVKRVGGVPAPFRTLDNRNLRSGEDAQGPYFWQEYRSGARTNCVLAFRNRQQGGRGIDMFLRNCVDGPIEGALAPILDGRSASSARPVGASAGGANRSLSPLAAPL